MLATEPPATGLMTPVAPAVFPARSELRHFASLTLTLARSELKQRYFGSALGYAWSLLRPLMMFGVLYVVFTYIIRFGNDVPHYPLVLLTSLVLWTYFAETTSLSVGSLVARDNLMRKIRFPRIAIPLSIALTTGFHLALNLVVVTVFVVASGVEPRVSWLLAPPLIAILVTFTVGVSLALATLYVKFRDLSSIWEVLVQTIFWGSPIIYPIEFPPEWLRGLIASNPASTVLIELRHAIFDPSAPTAVVALGGETWHLIIPAAIVVLVCCFATWLFARWAPGLAEEL